MASLLPPEECRSLGLLMEANRLFFHPLGFALTINTPTGDETYEPFYTIQDWRDDEGAFFNDLRDDDANTKTALVAALAEPIAERRTEVMETVYGATPEKHGYLLVQPIGSKNAGAVDDDDAQ